jgi:electron transfer flavoprotein alpha subunit
VLKKRGARRTPSETKPVRLQADPKGWLMAVVHTDRGLLDEHAREAIAAAAILASSGEGVLVAVLGELVEDLAPLGADLVAVFPALEASRFQPEQALAAVRALVKTYTPRRVVLPERAAEGDLGRRLVIAEAAEGEPSFGCDEARYLLLGAGAADPRLPFSGRGEVSSAAALPFVPEVSEVCRDLGREPLDPATLALEEADFIVSAGGGVADVSTVEALARTLGAAVGASRVAVDEGKLPRERQIGATGKTVTASAYVAVGISGAVQHLEGIKECRHVIAINRDAGAPIVKRADLSIIGDAEEVMRALLRRVADAKAQRETPEQG